VFASARRDKEYRGRALSVTDPECSVPMLATRRARCSGDHERTASGGSTVMVHGSPGTPPVWAREVVLWPKSEGIPWNSG
jgi:hypothetical protein